MNSKDYLSGSGFCSISEVTKIFVRTLCALFPVLVVIFLISLFLVCFPLQFFSFTAMFSHNFWFSIFAGVAVGREFLKQCEISQPANFRTVAIFFLRRTVHLLPTLSLPYNLSFPALH